MTFFGSNMVRKWNQEIENHQSEKLYRLSKFSPSEIEQIQLESSVSKEELLEVLEILYDSEIRFSEKVAKIKKHPYGVDVLIVISTMEH